MDKQILQSDLNQRARQYESLLPSLKDKLSDSRQSFISFVDSNAEIYKQSRDSKTTLPPKYGMIASDLVNKIEKTNTRYDEVQEQYYGIISKIKTIGNDQWQCITVVQKALPETSFYNTIILIYAVGGGILGLSLSLSVFVYVLQNQDQVELVKLAIKGK